MIANIGQSVLANTTSTKNEQKDYRALGLLMVRLMEFGTSLRNPDSLVLENPEAWSESIKAFVRETTQTQGSSLQKVPTFGCR